MYMEGGVGKEELPHRHWSGSWPWQLPGEEPTDDFLE